MDLSKISKALDTYVRLQSSPAAVRMLSSTDEIPKRVKMPKRDLRVRLAVCQGITLARRSGWTMAMGLEDMLCPIGSLTLGFLPAKAKFLDGSSGIPLWLKDQSARAKVTQELPRLELKKYACLLVAPVERADFEPHLIIIYGNPAQISRLIQANVYETGEPVVSHSSGDFACSEEITRTILTDQCQCVLTGGGDRTIAQAHDREAAFSIPISKVEVVIKGLEETHKAGLTYPTRPSFGFEPAFPPLFNELNDYLKGPD